MKALVTEIEGKPARYWGVILAAAVLAAIVSVAVQGFQFGISNNQFHLPIVLEFDKLPQFQNDPFILSLGSYSSFVWPIVRAVSTEGNVELVFYVFHIASRAFAIFAMAVFAHASGMRDLRLLGLAICAFALSASLQGYSVVGRGGLFINYFSHSEAAHGFVVLALVAAVQRKLLWAWVVEGIIFNINPFIAAWNGVAIAAAVALHVRASGSGRARHALIEPLVGGLIASPMLFWLWRVWQSQRANESFDYLDFLNVYFPAHFLASGSGFGRYVFLTVVVALGLLAIDRLEVGRREWKAIFLAYCAVVVTGILVPVVTQSRWILNLHLLRADTYVTMIAVTAAIVATVNCLDAKAPAARRLTGCLVLPVLTWSKLLLPIALAIAAFLRWGALPREWSFQRWLGGINPVLLRMLPVLILGMAGLSQFVWRLFVVDASLAPVRREWGNVVNWARERTTPDSTFLVLNLKTENLPSFQSFARRRLWFDFKSGAAAMWMPSFHEQWEHRRRELGAIAGARPLFDFACANDINYVVIAGSELPSALQSGGSQWAADGWPGVKVLSGRMFQVLEASNCGRIGQ